MRNIFKVSTKTYCELILFALNDKRLCGVDTMKACVVIYYFFTGKYCASHLGVSDELREKKKLKNRRRKKQRKINLAIAKTASKD